MNFGIDISGWDSPIDWVKYKTKGRFMFAKAFEYQQDRMFSDHWTNSKGNVDRGAYYFWRQSPDVEDKARTEKFLDVIGRENYDGELPVVIDLEDNKANRATVFKQMDRLSERIKQVTGRYPIIYTGLSYWKEIGGLKATPFWCSVHPMWISLPNLDYDPNFELKYQEILAGRQMPFIPNVPPYTKVDFIQWTYRGKPSDVPGYAQNGKKAVDFNLYLGSDTEYALLTKNQVITIPELTDKEKLDILWKEHNLSITR